MNLRKQNKLTFKFPKKLEDLNFSEKKEFMTFLDESYVEFINMPLDSFTNKEKTQETVQTTTTTTANETKEETTQKTEIIKEEEIQKEKIETEVKEKEKINTSTSKTEVKKNDVKEEKGLIRPRNNSYLGWILGAGLTGLIGVGLFFMLSKKKY